MANVGSWADIVDAITNATGGSLTLNLVKDINLVAEPDYVFGVQSLTLPSGMRSFSIAGHGHRIVNLCNDLSQTGGIFITEGTDDCQVDISDVDFVNLILRNASLVQGLNTDDEVITINCGFVGERNGTSYLFDVQKCHFTSCYFFMPWQGVNQNPAVHTSLVPPPATASDATNFEAEYCWFREHYTNWSLSSRWSMNDAKINGKGMYWSFYFIKINGCYIDGDMSMTNDSHTDHTDHFPIDVVHHPNRTVFTPTIMSVFNVNVTCVGSGTIIEYGSFFGLYINKIYKNHTNLTTWTNAYGVSTSASYPLPIRATEEQASDMTWLHENGFSI